MLKRSLKMEYPHYDCVWAAEDECGNLGAFVTGGKGPIPKLLLDTQEILGIEETILSLVSRSEVENHKAYPLMASFEHLAKRGFFVFDWSDVHRTSATKSGLYELVSSPLSPLRESLPFAPRLSELRFTDSTVSMDDFDCITS